MTECPECAFNITLKNDVEQGELLECEECGVDLEVKGPAPFSLALAPEEEEDWGE